MRHEPPSPASDGGLPTTKVSRRGFALSGLVATFAATQPRRADAATEQAATPCSTVPDAPTAERPEPQANWRIFSAPETALAFRNHGMQAELLREPITPLGAHFLLIHFDIPRLDAEGYSISIAGRVRRPTSVSLESLKARRTVTQAVTMECAGTGRSTMRPRAVYVPWAHEALGTYQWTGTPLRPLLEEAGLLDDAVEILFTGWDTGVDLGVEHAFERCLTVTEAMRDEVMLAWAHNGQTLLPQHGYPLRLIVPSWYGMASVKWLRAITVLNRPFEGIQQAKVYRYQQIKGEAGEPVQRKRVNSAMMPPGIPDLMTRHRFIAPGTHMIQGTAWSGAGRITRVDFSADNGRRWHRAELVPVHRDRFAWTQWRARWQVDVPGDYVLACRATDEAGNIQPTNPNAVWNRQGMGGNGVHRLPVRVQHGVGVAARSAPSPTQALLPGAEAPPPASDR